MATAAINRRRWSDNNLGDLTDAGPRFIAGPLEMENSFILSKKKKKKNPYSADRGCLFPSFIYLIFHSRARRDGLSFIRGVCLRPQALGARWRCAPRPASLPQQQEGNRLGAR